MKIFSAAQIKLWDQYTIQHEPVSSVDLMERASVACADWLLHRYNNQTIFTFFCGSGNNGGDGFAIARLLVVAGCTVKVYCLSAEKRSADNAINLERLKALDVDIKELKNEAGFPAIHSGAIVIEALFGTGLNKPLHGMAEKLVEHINDSMATVISIDLPAGLFADVSSIGNVVIKANYTLSFQLNKLAFLLDENAAFIGDVHLLNIGLHLDYYNQTASNFLVIDNDLIQSIYKPRNKIGHKYSYGHALLYAGSQPMMGAAILCAKACLRSGAGLVTLHIKEALMPVLQIALPEAISSDEKDTAVLQTKKAAIGIGPGLQINEENETLLQQVITDFSGPVVIDASGLALLKPQLDLLVKRKTDQSILSPHTGEFEKLFGKTSNDFERLQLAFQKAAQHNCCIILKGPHTLIACPDGNVYFNSTGNSGMATAGSGDVLTGILTGLLAQGYKAKDAAILGVYLHGLAGDYAAEALSKEAMLAGDIIEQLGTAYKELAAGAARQIR